MWRSMAFRWRHPKGTSQEIPVVPTRPDKEGGNLGALDCHGAEGNGGGSKRN